MGSQDTNTLNHGRPTSSALDFNYSTAPAPSHAERARTLVEGQSTGSLGSLALEPAGYPYTSYSTFAWLESEPLFFISKLAEHTRNLTADARASLLVHESGRADPLAHARVTLLGQCRKLGRSDAARAAYVARHPNAAYYIEYDDFDFYRLSIEAVRYIGGYGRMSWVDADDFRNASADPVAAAAERVLSHMNEDHTDALLAYARAFTAATDATQAVMTAVDRYGFEMTVTTPRGAGPVRLGFEQPLTQPAQAREALVALFHAAQAKLGHGSA